MAGEAMKGQIFKTEADLCGCFMDFAIRDGWEIDAELSGHWDLLLTRTVEGEIEQWGVHGKLVPNIDVIHQAVRDMRKPKGPTAAVVLVPRAGDSFRFLCSELGLYLAVPNLERSDLGNGKVYFDVTEPPAFNKHPAAPERLERPRYENSTKPGSKSPSVVSDWMEKQLRLEVLLEAKGYLRKEDFRRVGWPIHSVKAPGWLWKLKGRDRYEPVIEAKLPSAKQPKAFKKIREEMTKKGLANV
jgi:hypothetical protein